MVSGRFAGDPVAVRKAVGVPAEGNILFDFVTRNCHVVTNWCFDARLQGAGLVTEVRCPVKAIVSQCIVPKAVIINADRETTMVNCNIDAKDLARGKLLSHLIAA